MNQKQRRRFAGHLARYAKAWHEVRMAGGKDPEQRPFDEQEFEEAYDAIHECVEALVKEGPQPEAAKQPRKAKA